MAQQKVKPMQAEITQTKKAVVIPDVKVTSAVRVATANGTTFLLHPFTQCELTPEPKEMEIDEWVRAQLAAGKVVLC